MFAHYRPSLHGFAIAPRRLWQGQNHAVGARTDCAIPSARKSGGRSGWRRRGPSSAIQGEDASRTCTHSTRWPSRPLDSRTLQRARYSSTPARIASDATRRRSRSGTVASAVAASASTRTVFDDPRPHHRLVAPFRPAAARAACRSGGGHGAISVSILRPPSRQSRCRCQPSHSPSRGCLRRRAPSGRLRNARATGFARCRDPSRPCATTYRIRPRRS